jgi:hypothetical protein
MTLILFFVRFRHHNEVGGWKVSSAVIEHVFSPRQSGECEAVTYTCKYPFERRPKFLEFGLRICNYPNATILPSWRACFVAGSWRHN